MKTSSTFALVIATLLTGSMMTSCGKSELVSPTPVVVTEDALPDPVITDVSPAPKPVMVSMRTDNAVAKPYDEGTSTNTSTGGTTDPGTLDRGGAAEGLPATPSSE